jgi:hypothetical protein
LGEGVLNEEVPQTGPLSIFLSGAVLKMKKDAPLAGTAEGSSYMSIV